MKKTNERVTSQKCPFLTGVHMIMKKKEESRRTITKAGLQRKGRTTKRSSKALENEKGGACRGTGRKERSSNALEDEKDEPCRSAKN